MVTSAELLARFVEKSVIVANNRAAVTVARTISRKVEWHALDVLRESEAEQRAARIEWEDSL